MDSDYSFFSISGAEQRQSRFTDISLLHESGKGFCRIFLARLFGRKVILKTLKAEYADSAPHRDLLYKEYIIGRDMSHPGIVATYLFARDIDGIGDSIVMEYVEGVTLKQWLADNPPMPPALARPLRRRCRPCRHTALRRCGTFRTTGLQIRHASSRTPLRRTTRPA